LILTKWLPQTPSTIPAPPTHFVGVGGVVINSNKEILVVKEKTGPATQLWKVPGGQVEAGEDIATAAIREIKEETGIDTRFECILSVREHHNSRFGKSDLYWTCLLSPLNSNIIIQPAEIQDAKWMKVTDFLELPYYSRGVYRAIIQLAVQGVTQNSDGSLKYQGWKAYSLPIGFVKGNNTIYHGHNAAL